MRAEVIDLLLLLAELFHRLARPFQRRNVIQRLALLDNLHRAGLDLRFNLRHLSVQLRHRLEWSLRLGLLQCLDLVRDVVLHLL